MNNGYWLEQWKEVTFDFEFTNKYRLEVSNWGRVRTFTKLGDGRILGGSTTEGYRIIRLKFYSPREPHLEEQFKNKQKAISQLFAERKQLVNDNAPEAEIHAITELIAQKKAKLSKEFTKDLARRTIHYQSLVHRLVATYFLPKPSPEANIIAHLDYNKLNNRVDNLRWMTAEENQKHRLKSPNVIADQQRRKLRLTPHKNTKLSETKVMLLKKLLNENKPIKQLVKIFKVTETQILRIKRGENWADVKAAE
ncbi:MAG TPA: HNH endonuclease [Ferruginibacter sp.]|nr:HNH endonuclease [Ferruginibacter sp.]HRO16785.1 HNH endonuclease [Ferruginibacter sp.]HRQ20321.1 HNH endonuclease [Ferruginibacter sp.]